MHWRPALLAGVLGVVVYAVTVGGSYVYDDVTVIREDARVHGPDRWKELLTTAYLRDAPDRLYRPVTMLSYAVQWRMHGDCAWAFHLVNVLLHGLVAAGVAVLAGQLGGRAVAYVAGVLFAVHPVHVEAVANIVGRAELLCALGTVLALIWFFSGRLTWGRCVGVIVCFLVALFSKEQGMLLPFFVGAAVLLKLRETKVEERRAMAVLLGVLCWGLAAYIVAREMSDLKFSWDLGQLDATVQPLVKARGWDRIGVPISLVGRYAMLLVAPVRLSPDYGGRTIGSVARVSDPFMYVGLLVLIVWIGAMVVAWRRGDRKALFCLIGLGLSYGMISNIPTLIGTIMAERLMYLPSVFFLILVAMALVRLKRKALVLVVGLLVLLASWRTIAYAARWNDPVSFYRWAAADQPGSVRLPMLLAQELRDQHELDAAAKAAAEARDIAPEYWHTWFLSAQIALDAGKLDEADALLTRAFHLKESNPMAVIGLRQAIAQRRSDAATQPRP